MSQNKKEEKVNTNINTSVSVFTLIASLVTTIFVMMFWIERLYPVEKETISKPMLTKKIQPVVPIIPKQQADQKRQVLTPKKYKEQTKLIIIKNTQAERRINTAAARYIQRIMPKLSHLKLVTLEHYVTTGQFPNALAEVWLDHNEIIDGDNIAEIHFYNKTILLLLNSKKFNANHWVSLTTYKTLGDMVWNCYTSIYDPNNLPIGCNTHPSPPVPKQN